MKYRLTLTAAILSALCAGARTVSGLTAGGLASAGIEPTETELTVSGNMNAADFAYIFDNLPQLQKLDISRADIEAYAGAPLKYTGMYRSPANTLPAYSLTGLTELREIVLPESLEAIGKGALSGAGITSLTVPPSVTSIDDYACMRCPRLKSVNIPGGVTRIGTRAFAYCPELSDVSIAASLPSLPEGIFEACGGLKTLDLQMLAQCTEIGPWALADCGGIETLVLPSGSTAIGKGALYGTSSVGILELPPTIDRIGDNAMTAMTALNTINASQVNRVPELGENVWSRVDQAKVVLVTPNDRAQAYGEAEQWKEFYIMPLDKWQSSTESIDINAGTRELTATLSGEVLTVKSAGSSPGRVAIFDVAGRRVAGSPASAGSTVTFNVGGWPGGVYLIVSEIGIIKITI